MKAEVRKGTIVIDYEDLITQYGELKDADITDGFIIVNTDEGHKTIPLTGEWGDWSEVVAEWNKMYPNGKPLPEPVILPKTPDEIDILMAENLDMRCKIDEQDKLINQLMIASLEA